MTKTYRADVTFEDGWIVIRVPELELVTQAEGLAEIERTARDIIALELHIDIAEVQVELRPDATAHLLRSPANAARLKASIEQLEGPNESEAAVRK